MTRLAAVAMSVAVLTLAACGGDGAKRTIVVSAAASLSDAFAEVEAAFEIANPGVDVVLNLAGSSVLREQIIGGAPIDVFAAADTATMDDVVRAGAAADPVPFARNEMQIAVPVGNPGGVTSLSDFSRSELLIGLCAEPVPCGRIAREVFANAGITPSADTDEPDVRSLLTKVELGELDAGVVYVTDVIATDAVEGIPIDSAANVMTDYPIAVLAGADEPEVAAAFLAFVVSATGRAILLEHGFEAP